MDDDLAALRAWRAGDRAAGQALVERYFDAVCRFFRTKLGDDVEDLVQKTFLGCMESLERIDETLGFRPYLFGIARHRLIDVLRRASDSLDPSVQSLEDLCTTPSQRVVRDEELALLSRALRSLPLDYQITLELFYWENMRGRAIAHVLEVSEHTVRSRMTRAREQLRIEIERLASSPELSASTLEGLEKWAKRVGDLALAEAPGRLSPES